jgi:hypothetical protein
MHWKNLCVLATLALATVPALAAAPVFLPTVTPDFVVNTHSEGAQSSPAVAAGASGGFVVVWLEEDELPGGAKARRFDSTGAPLGPEIYVGFRQFEPPGRPLRTPRIASAADGSFVVAWTGDSDIWLRRFDSQGQPLADSEQVSASSFTDKQSPDVAMAPGGSFVVVWMEDSGPSQSVFAQRFDAAEGRVGDRIQISPDGPGSHKLPRVAVTGDGGFLAVWESSGAIVARRFGASGNDGATRQIGTLTSFEQSPAVVVFADGTATVAWTSIRGLVARQLDAAGAPTGPETVLDPTSTDPLEPPALAAGRAGNTLMVWDDLSSGQLRARLYDRGLTPVTDVFHLGETFPASRPAAAATSSGGFAAVWTSGLVSTFPGLPPPPIPGKDGSSEGIVGRLFGALTCSSDAGVLCLDHGRFEARVAWRNPFTGETGSGHARSLTTDTGAFWFFGDQNLELMVKVLDGTSVNLRYWLYAGALSNVEYTLTVTDTLTGVERTYHNPAGQFASLADVTAFPFGLSDTAPATSSPAVVPSLSPVVGCLPLAADPTSLCLGSGQFLVNVSFTDPRTGLTGAATAVPLTGDTGAFWFFDPSNLELMVKVLDGRAINGKFWVFYGALSDVDYTLTVTDTQTGQQKTYHNPRGTLASRGDTQAF